MPDLLLKKEVYEIVGAAMEVHRELGHGFLEAIYQEALGIVLKEKGIPYEAEKEVQIHFKGKPLTKKYRLDFLIDNEIIVETKAQTSLTNTDEAQLLNYLKATGHKVGLLINFGKASLQYKRMVY
jgi:GxxExxY protein